ncbi:MAG: hypothetical protein AAF499_11005 [Pseudomonadota bacterium]
MTQSQSDTSANTRPAGVWLICAYLLLTESIAIGTLLLSWSPTLAQQVFGSDVYADFDAIHLALIFANTVLWLTVAFDLYHMRRRAARLLGVAFVVGVVDVYWQATHGWVAHEDRVQYLINTGGVLAFTTGAALLVGILIYVQRLERRGVLV